MVTVGQVRTRLRVRSVLSSSFIREDGFVQLVAPRRNQRVTPWTWDINVADFDDLVVADGLELLASGRLSRPSAALLPRLKPLKLYRFGSTRS